MSAPDWLLIWRPECGFVFFNVGHVCSMLSAAEVDRFELIPVQSNKKKEVAQPQEREGINGETDGLEAVQSGAGSGFVLPSAAGAAVLAANGEFDDDDDEDMPPMPRSASNRAITQPAPGIQGIAAFPEGAAAGDPDDDALSDLDDDEEDEESGMADGVRGQNGSLAALPRSSSDAAFVYGSRVCPPRVRPTRLRAVLLDLSCVQLIDTTGVRGLYQLCLDYATRERPVTVHFANVVPHVKQLLRMSLVCTTAFPHGLSGRLHATVADGVAAIRAQAAAARQRARSLTGLRNVSFSRGLLQSHAVPLSSVVVAPPPPNSSRRRTELGLAPSPTSATAKASDVAAGASSGRTR